MVKISQKNYAAACLMAVFLLATIIIPIAHAQQTTNSDNKGDLKTLADDKTDLATEPIIPKPRAKPLPPKPLFAACSNLPDTLKIVFKPLPPIAEAASCGHNMPLRLSSLAQSARVDIKPPATTNCILTEALARWLKQSVQLFADKLLDSPVVKIINVSSYACRNRNNATKGRLSEHAFANALDIAGFVLASGDTISVKQHWTQDSRKARFLYVIHRQACRFFGTVLGPEANALHHDHFHFDMAKRRQRNYCE